MYHGDEDIYQALQAGATTYFAGCLRRILEAPELRQDGARPARTRGKLSRSSVQPTIPGRGLPRHPSSNASSRAARRRGARPLVVLNEAPFIGAAIVAVYPFVHRIFVQTGYDRRIGVMIAADA